MTIFLFKKNCICSKDKTAQKLLEEFTIRVGMSEEKELRHRFS